MTEVSAISFPLSYVAIFANRLLLNLAAGHQAGRAEWRLLAWECGTCPGTHMLNPRSHISALPAFPTMKLGRIF